MNGWHYYYYFERASTCNLEHLSALYVDLLFSDELFRKTTGALDLCPAHLLSFYFSVLINNTTSVKVTAQTNSKVAYKPVFFFEVAFSFFFFNRSKSSLDIIKYREANSNGSCDPLYSGHCLFFPLLEFFFVVSIFSSRGLYS